MNPYTGYCDYCGFSYIERTCRICGATITVCGCDPHRDFCEDHCCLGCDEPHAELNDDGLCPYCVEELAEKLEGQHE